MVDDPFRFYRKLQPKARRSSACPEPEEYWRFFDEDTREPQLLEHFHACSFCQAEIQAVATAIATTEAPSSSQLARLSQRLPQPARESLLVKLLGNSLQALSPQLVPAQHYRSTPESPHPDILSRDMEWGKIQCRIEIHKRQGEAELMIELKRSSRDLTCKLFRGTKELRSYQLKPREKKSLSHWPQGHYVLQVLDDTAVLGELDIVVL